MKKQFLAASLLALSVSSAEAQVSSIVRNESTAPSDSKSVVRIKEPTSLTQTINTIRKTEEQPVSVVKTKEQSAPVPAETRSASSSIVDASHDDNSILSAVKSCTALVSPQGVTREFNASVNVAAHLVFPLPIASAHISTTLWTEDHHANSLWIRPKQSTHMADTVGLTVTMTDGRQFDYTVKSVAEPTNCYLVVPFPFAGPSSLSPEQLLEVKKAALMAQALKRKIAQAEARKKINDAASFRKQFNTMKQQVVLQAEDRIKQFQMSIHTHYNWSNHDLITSVYDDGEMTYIRASKTGYGTPILTGKHSGQPVALEYDYDDLTGVYVITGIYDKINAVLGSNHVLIKRKG